MKKYLIIIAVVIGIWVLINIIQILIFFWPTPNPEIVSKTIKTPYGDSFYIQHEIYSIALSKPTEVRFRVYYNDEEIIFWQDIGGSLYDLDMENRMHIVINMAAEGEIRAYEFNWGILYTVDDGKSFKGAPMISYMEYYTGNEEFAEAYSMLYEKPFYDERFKEHLDMNRYKLLDSETAEEISISKTKSIRDVEELAGKAQRCVLVDTEEGTENIQSVTFEYDLSDGRILVVHYLNQCEGNNLDLYLSHNYIREVYNPEEDQSPEATPTQPASYSPSAAAA